MKNKMISIVILLFIYNPIFAGLPRNINLDYGKNELSIKIVNISNLDYKNIQVLVNKSDLPKGIYIKKNNESIEVNSESNSINRIYLNIKIDDIVEVGMYEIPINLKDNSDHTWQFLIKGNLERSLPEDYILFSNYPNPFNSATKLKYELKKTNNTKLIIFDQMGNQVKSLVNKQQSSGVYTVIWNGKNEKGIEVPSGVYFYKLTSGCYNCTKKMIFLK